jgi:hypothetical protein
VTKIFQVMFGKPGNDRSYKQNILIDFINFTEKEGSLGLEKLIFA